MSEKKEFAPLVSNDRIKSMAIDKLGGNLHTILSIPNLEDDYDHRRNAGIQVRDIYEAERAASREIIEKMSEAGIALLAEVLDAAETFQAMHGTGDDTLDDNARRLVKAAKPLKNLITEARAFLNKKP